MGPLSSITARVATWSDEPDVLDRFAIAGLRPTIVVWPDSVESVAEVLRLASEAGLALVPAGGGTMLETGNPPHAYDIALCLTELDDIVEYEPADLTITVQAGMTLDRLARTVAPNRQRVALDPPFPERATLGGVLASATTGPARLRFGGARDTILGLTIALCDGTIARSGGRVVKNVAGYDLTRLLIGSYGTLAVIVGASLKLFGLPDRQLVVKVELHDLAGASQWVRSAVQLGAEATFLVADHQDGIRGIARFSGSTGVVERQTAAGLRLAGPGAVVEPLEADKYYRHGLDRPAVVRITFPPARIGEVAGLIPGRDGADLLLDGSGVGRIGLDSLDPSFVSRLRDRCALLGGSVVIERQPPTGAMIDAWGDPPATLSLMRGLKAQFDPTVTLSRGRFVGGL